jgi:hypothetical protein
LVAKAECRLVQKALRNRARRGLIGSDGNLMILAADHTARGMLAAGGDPLAVADRFTLLDRLIRGLANPGVDGVMARLSPAGVHARWRTWSAARMVPIFFTRGRSGSRR